LERVLYEGVKEVDHPGVGEMTLTYNRLELAAD
jgi:hypothetical protein